MVEADTKFLFSRELDEVGGDDLSLRLNGLLESIVETRAHDASVRDLLNSLERLLAENQDTFGSCPILRVFRLQCLHLFDVLLEC